MRIFILFAIVIAAMTFAVQNAAAITLNLFTWRFDVSLALVVMSCFIAGAVVLLLAISPQLYRLHRLRAHERLLKAQLADLETQQGSRAVNEPTTAHLTEVQHATKPD